MSKNAKGQFQTNAPGKIGAVPKKGMAPMPIQKTSTTKVMTHAKAMNRAGKKGTSY